MNQIRIWKEIDIQEIDKHLLICDDLHAYCNSCRKMGITIDTDCCPECGTSFKYITTREKHTSNTGGKILQRMITKSNAKTVIDYNDYKHISDKNKDKATPLSVKLQKS